MRFSFIESMCPPAEYLPLAVAAEEAGYTGFAVPDSIFCPQETSDVKYPYTDTGDRSFLEGAPFIEPFTLIPAMAAVTKRLRFVTFVMKLAIRQPVLVAKSLTSVAVMTNNRFGFGVGVSPWPEDFAACGQPWKGRGKRMDEMIEIIRGLAKGGFYEFHGTYYDIPSIKLCPVPTEPIPILIGGHSEAALRRAARVGNGWMHAGSGDLVAMIARLNQLRQEYGREREPFQIYSLLSTATGIEFAHQFQDIGVTDIIVGCRNAYDRSTDAMTLNEKLDQLRRYADNVIAKV